MVASLNSSDFSSHVFDFEKNFDFKPFHAWTLDNWSQTFIYSLVYVVAIFGAQYYMKDKPRFHLRLPLFFWSGFLAIFSIAGAIRTLPELMHILKSQGWYPSMCNPSYFHSHPTSFWSFMFVISKVLELGDTLFVVLTKKPLIFLHWYHHISVMIYVWYSYTDYTAPGRWFMVMNYIVHSFMYTYYSLRALQVKVPKKVSLCITSLQIFQMIMGMVVNLSVYVAKRNGLPCSQTDLNLLICSLMYFSYLYLFSVFFFNAYIKTPSSSSSLKKQH